MIRVRFRQADGSAQEIAAREGFTLMEAATRNGVPGILAECGGACSCATCHVVVDEDYFDLVGTSGSDEADLLSFVPEANPRSRLSCQIRLTAALDGLTVTVPAAQR